jgi:hypothetical protein
MTEWQNSVESQACIASKKVLINLVNSKACFEVAGKEMMENRKAENLSRGEIK